MGSPKFQEPLLPNFETYRHSRYYHPLTLPTAPAPYRTSTIHTHSYPIQTYIANLGYPYSIYLYSYPYQYPEQHPSPTHRYVTI